MLVDRDEERGVLDQLIEATRVGISGALVVHGEAGMGKTALLDYATDAAADLHPVRIAGVETESGFGFAALHRLLLPFLDNLDRLPEPQRNALSSAFGLGSHAPADVFLVGLATLSLLADSASTTGMLCVVDDAQWIDEESLQVMAFVGRRLIADGIALIFGFRTSSEIPPTLAGLPEMEVKGLPEWAAIKLLNASVPGPIDTRVALRIVAETSGCPLALVEIADGLTEGQLVGTHHLSQPIPISRRLEEHFRRNVDSLAPEAQTFLLVAAADTSGDAFLVRRVAAELGCNSAVERSVVRERYLTMDPRVEFRHPLIRSAIYSFATPAERQKVHRTLARSIDRSIDPDRYAQHLAAVAIGPDETLAVQLEDSAHRARLRGGYTAEASLLAQAAGFTEDSAKRSERLLAAAAAALEAGAPARATELLAQARPGLVDPLLEAEAQRLDGRLRVALTQVAAAPSLFLSAARMFLPHDLGRARQSMLQALDAFLMSQHFTVMTSGVEIAEAALLTRGDEPPSQLMDLLLDGTSLLLAVGFTEGVETLHKAAALLREGEISTDDIARWFNFGSVIANELWDDRTYGVWAQRVETSARSQGALFALQVTLVSLATHEIRAGRFAVADAHFAESLEITAAMCGAVELYRPLNVELLAWRGDDAGTRTAARMLIEAGNAFEMPVVVFMAYRAIAILELSAGRYGEALAAAENLTTRDAIGWTCQGLPLVVEAGARSGNRAISERALSELAKRARSSGTDWALGLLARSQAILADDGGAESFFMESIEHLEKTVVVVDLAMAHLLYGEWLRRQQRRLDARSELRVAYDAFALMGAEGFAERARAELEATGERLRRRTQEAQSNLTAQELHIAQLAAQGDTNSDIAAKLFISSSTVDYHLRKVYRKLGISSRRQLDHALPD